MVILAVGSHAFSFYCITAHSYLAIHNFYIFVFNVGIAAGFSVTLARDKVPTNWQPIGVLSREKQRVSD